MDEITKLGAVISARRPGESALTRWTHTGYGIWGSEIFSARASWEELEDHKLLHEGYTPPTPEPLLYAAVVRDAAGSVVTRTGTRQDPWLWDDRSTGRWAALCHPVEILFAGVDS